MSQTLTQTILPYRIGRATAGLGLFATRAFIKDDFVIEYTGERITHAEADKRGGRYLFTLNDVWTLDGTDRHYTARYLNHSCEPNCEAIIEDDEQIMIYAMKKIASGEELTFDYGEEYFTDIIGGAKNCRCHVHKEKSRDTY